MGKWIDYVSINPEPAKALPNVPQPTIKYGTRGTKAMDLQSCLNYCGYNLTVDGLFFQKSTEALRDWQRKNRLEVDGIYGKNSCARMRELIK